jgi:hypothetical protein
MTIATTSNKAQWQGNGSTTVFPFNFEIGNVSQIKLTLTSGGSVTPISPSAFAVSGLGSPSGGTIVYPLSGSPIPQGATLLLVRTVPLQQLTDLQNQSNYFPDAVEGALDYLMMVCQQIASQAAYSIQAPQTDQNPQLVLPSSSGRINMLLGFDDNGNVTVYPITASVGAGNLTAELGANGRPGFKAGTDFAAGTTQSLNLSQAYGSVANVQVFFDGAYVEKDEYQLVNKQITFGSYSGDVFVPSAIPIGTANVDIIGGTTLSLYVPPNGSVGDAQITPGSKLGHISLHFNDVQNLGAVGDGVTNDCNAFASNVPAIFVTPGSADYLVSSNTTVTADLFFLGGVITVPSGITLTINGSIIAPSKVLFQGLGTVVINRGVIDVAWFDGADASAKTAFCLRGVNNTNGTGKTLAYYPPQPNDAWATQSPNGQWGYGWKVASSIRLEQTQNYTVYLTHTCFIATASMDAVFTLGYAGVGSSSNLKADGQIFPLRLKVDGGNGLANWAVRIYGSSHSKFDHVEAYYCGGIAFTPESQMQCSDISVGFLDTGALYQQAVLMDGTYGVNNTITDIEVGFVNSTGFSNGHAADSVVKIGSNTNGISVRKVSHRAVVSGVGGAFQDATEAVVLITNGGSMGSTLVSPRYGINIGPVLNGSATLTAEAVVVADASSGAAAKMTGITLDAGSQVDGTPPGGATISLNYTSGAVVQGMPGASTTNSAQIVAVNSTCVDTQIYGVAPSQVSDAGTNTLVNGRNHGAITSIAAPGSGVAWVNNNHFRVKFQIQGATTITNVVYTRGGTSLTVANSGTAGWWEVAPGDNIAISYTGSPSFNVVPI